MSANPAFKKGLCARKAPSGVRPVGHAAKALQTWKQLSNFKAILTVGIPDGADIDGINWEQKGEKNKTILMHKIY